MNGQQLPLRCKCDEPLTVSVKGKGCYNICSECRAKGLLAFIKILDVFKKINKYVNCTCTMIFSVNQIVKRDIKVIIENQLHRTAEQKPFPFMMIIEQAASA